MNAQDVIEQYKKGQNIFRRKSVTQLVTEITSLRHRIEQARVDNNRMQEMVMERESLRQQLEQVQAELTEISDAMTTKLLPAMTEASILVDPGKSDAEHIKRAAGQLIEYYKSFCLLVDINEYIGNDDTDEADLPGMAEEIRDERDELRKQLAQARAAIKAVEWVGTPGNEYCPWCGVSKHGGHDHRCPRNLALKGGEK